MSHTSAMCGGQSPTSTISTSTVPTTSDPGQPSWGSATTPYSQTNADSVSVHVIVSWFMSLSFRCQTPPTPWATV